MDGRVEGGGGGGVEALEAAGEPEAVEVAGAEFDAVAQAFEVGGRWWRRGSGRRRG